MVIYLSNYTAFLHFLEAIKLKRLFTCLRGAKHRRGARLRRVNKVVGSEKVEGETEIWCMIPILRKVY